MAAQNRHEVQLVLFLLPQTQTIKLSHAEYNLQVLIKNPTALRFVLFWLLYDYCILLWNFTM